MMLPTTIHIHGSEGQLLPVKRLEPHEPVTAVGVVQTMNRSMYPQFQVLKLKADEMGQRIRDNHIPRRLAWRALKTAIQKPPRSLPICTTIPPGPGNAGPRRQATYHPDQLHYAARAHPEHDGGDCFYPRSSSTSSKLVSRHWCCRVSTLCSATWPPKAYCQAFGSSARMMTSSTTMLE